MSVSTVVELASMRSSPLRCCDALLFRCAWKLLFVRLLDTPALACPISQLHSLMSAIIASDVDRTILLAFQTRMFGCLGTHSCTAHH